MLSMLFYSLLLVDFVTSQETAKQVPIENKVVTPDEVTDERNNNGWPITDGGGPTYNNQYFGYDPCETAVEIRRKNSQDKTWRNGNFGQGTFWYNPYPYWNNLRKTNVFFLTDYGNNMHCYHRFGSECRYGVQVWFRDFRLEAHTDQYCPWDYFAFGWTDTSGRRVYPSQKKNRYCGCFTNTYYGCRNLQNSLPEDNFDLLAIFTKYGRRTSWRPEIDNYNLIPPSFNVNTYVRRDIRWHSNKKIAGRDPVFTFKSDVSKYGGEIAVEWECTPYSASVTRTRVTVRRRTPLTQAVSAILALWSRSSVLSDMQESLLSNAKKVNPYGESADTNVTMSGDDNNIFAVIDFNGILDDTVALDKTVLARNVISATKNTMSSKKFNQFVDTRSISAKVELPPTITNTEQMADKLLDGSFEPQMALNYGCASQGYFDAFGETFGKPRDSTDAVFFKWKKCVQCATGGSINPYNYDEDEGVCGETNRALCECDLALMKYLKTAEPTNQTFNLESCVESDHHSKLDCCNWRQHYWAAYNPDHFECDPIEGLKTIGDF